MEIFIESNVSLLDAIKKMDANDNKLLIVTENSKYVSLLSIGDIQRYLIKHQTLEVEVKKALGRKVKVGYTSSSEEEIKDLMLSFRMEFLPILDEENNINRIVFWNDLFQEDHSRNYGKVACPVVVMAGGKGTRLRPITHIIPKPLIPLGDKTILELIFSNFAKVNCHEFYISVNYKAELIDNYIKDFKQYKIATFKEDKPLGTAGSLRLLKEKIKTTFFVSNCDILIDEDYSEIYKYHKHNKNDLTLVSAVKNYSIPYGILNIKENGILKSVDEKPDLTFQVNAGLYLLEPELLDEIPEDEFFHITHLMEKITKKGGRVGVYPVSENAWSDIGEWKEYNQTANKLGVKTFEI
ncbi:nucleotidyltransferase family protein [Flammeovirga pacifica]|uniref:Mannose-1-phosphate guanylyltransferase n=1 Tax=Flammeovirga pacifica TaxID=915059 RepID=A0A1S1YX29_FLAPC|nr:nucleotidyltransferase family protein [Flammeovirga pacifica]OHX65564.1 mannose-1-phosphate guanylyltransferase [Flammeovirga pacifica]